MNEYTLEKKHVDVIVKYFYPIAGGIENNIMQTYVKLQEQFAWDVTIHTSADTYTAKNSLPATETINGLKVKRYSWGILGMNPKIDWGTTDVVAIHNFDIFFFRYLVWGLYLKLTGRKKFTLILTPHGGFNPEWLMFSPWQRLIKKAYTYSVGTWLINAVVDGVRAVSEWEKGEESKHINPRKIHMIDNGLEDEAYVDVVSLASDTIKNQVRLYGKYILQIGRVYPIKNFETAISCLSFLPEDVKLVIVGQVQDEEYKKILIKLVKELRLENRVVFAGVIRGVDKYYVIRNAIAMVHMALWESGCNVVREGMSQGLPCIVSNVYGLPGLVKDEVNGFCLPVYDAQLVAEKVSWVMDSQNAQQVAMMRSANEVFGRGQSWNDVARKMNTLYRTGTQTFAI